MHIRQATESDIPGILKVLKASLGESSSKKTEQVWRYKHVDNPFGKSLVLIAVENDQIIGVRAFMRWQWQLKKSTFSAFRAVDTATDPNFQGKGIFKKLTLKALEKAKEEGDHFVFNTPNAQSKPGYLKMGWKEINKIKLSVKLTNPLNYFFKAEHLKYTINANCSDDNLQLLVDNYNIAIRKKSEVFTPKTRAFLKWRYEENKLQNYQVYYSEDIYIAGYLKSRGKLTELRISECIYTTQKAKKMAKSLVNRWNKDFKANIITYNLPVNNPFSLSFNGNYGPAFTFKEIQLDSKPESFFLNLQNWNYSLGDLELF